MSIENFTDKFEWALELDNAVGQIVRVEQDGGIMLLTKITTSGNEIRGLKLTSDAECVQVSIGIKTFEDRDSITPLGVRLDNLRYWENVFSGQQVICKESGGLFKFRGFEISESNPDEILVLIEQMEESGRRAVHGVSEGEIISTKVEKGTQMKVPLRFFEDMFHVSPVNPTNTEGCEVSETKIPAPPEEFSFIKPAIRARFGELNNRGEGPSAKNLIKIGLKNPEDLN